MSTQKSMNQCSRQPSLISLRSKKIPLNLMQSFYVELKGKQVQILISTVILFPWELYLCPIFPFSKAQTFFFFHSVMRDSDKGRGTFIWAK